MKILAVSHEYPPLGGGGANAAYNILNRFIEKGHSVSIITTATKRPDVYVKDNNLEIHEVASKRKRTDSCSFIEMFDYLIKADKKADILIKNALAKKQPYDIVLVFFGIPSGPIGYRLKRKYGVPYIVRFGGGDVPGFQKRFNAVYKMLGLLIRMIWKEADARIANSNGLKKMAMEYCDKYEFDVVPNGVDTDFFSPRVGVGNTGDCINILFVSRLIERKGLQYFLPILKRISNRTEKRVQLTVVGKGPFKETLEKITEETGVSDLVSFVGEKRGIDLVHCYREGDIFILPSSNEGMPNVVLEAMSCGLPIIMTPCQGSDELIDNNGYIANIADFEEAVLSLINDDEARIRMGSISRKRAVSFFSWDSVAEEYIKKMESVLFH